MIVENQKVKVKWNGRNKQHFISKGYLYTKLGDEFEVNPIHLTHGSDAKILVHCDYCNKNKTILFNQYYEQVIKHGYNKYCCKECGSKKISDLHTTKRIGFRNAKKCNKNENQSIIYEIDYEHLKELNDDQLILINEVKRFCEENNKFPNEKEMSNKNGYVSRTQFYKTFNTNTFTDIFRYIYPLQLGTRNKEITNIQKQINKPEYFKCSKCKIKKKFTKENFSENKASKYGLKTICRNCENKYAFKLRYKNKGIEFNNWKDITPEQWWEYLYEGKVGYLPDFCLDEENIIKIIRYIFLNKFSFNKQQICEFNLHDLKKYKVYHLYTRYYDKLKFLTLCFPEFNIKIYDLPKSLNATDKDKILFIEDWMRDNEYSINDILNGNYTTDQLKMKSFVAVNFNRYIDMFLWYFEYKNILHPINDTKITIHDFKYKPEHFWDDENNRLKCIRNYCFSKGIEKVLNNNKLLRKWVYKYFKNENINSLFNYSKYYKSIYELLIIAFPIISENNLLFEWEWHQCNKNDKVFLIKMLREAIMIREGITDPFEISRFMNHTTLTENGYNKFVKHVQRGRFQNYYEWACLSFPEFKNQWKIDDFYKFITKDGYICDSLEEVKIYEFIKYNLGIKTIEAIGTTYKGEHSFELLENNKEKWYCPDFVINENERVYIEYFGMYTENPPKDNKLLNNYKNKTLRKINYYNKQAFKFIYLYPEDIRDSFNGLIDKFKDANLINDNLVVF